MRAARAPRPLAGEQLGLPLREPLEARYARWAATPEGRKFLAEVERIALAWALEPRVEVNLIWAWVRKEQHVVADNSFRALAARWLVRHPCLAEKIEIRARAGERRKRSAGP